MIKYTKSNVSDLPKFSTQKYGNLLCDTYQGIVDQGSDGLWAGWLVNWSRLSEGSFKLGFKSKRAATRWVNQKLREVGVR